MADATTQRKLVGFAFDNPDLKNSYHAPGWGLLISPDELRYDELFGQPLIAEADSFTFTDEQLKDYARRAIGLMERELNIDILPRIVRYMDRIGQDGNAVTRTDIDDSAWLKRLNIKQKAQLYIREPGYAYKVLPNKYEVRIKLRRRPVRDVLTAKFAVFYTGQSSIDLMPYRVVKPDLSGVCYFRPNRMLGQNWEILWPRFFYNPAYRNLQDIFLIDYSTGYENCAAVPDDLRYVIIKIAAIYLMATYGDGKMASIASRSVNLNSVSESISTTMSATSAAFGARILQYQKEVKQWLADNKQKYSRTGIGAL